MIVATTITTATTIAGTAIIIPNTSSESLGAAQTT
jgi:hypothetical protein